MKTNSEQQFIAQLGYALSTRAGRITRLVLATPPQVAIYPVDRTVDASPAPLPLPSEGVAQVVDWNVPGLQGTHNVLWKTWHFSNLQTHGAIVTENLLHTVIAVTYAHLGTSSFILPGVSTGSIPVGSYLRMQDNLPGLIPTGLLDLYIPARLGVGT